MKRRETRCTKTLRGIRNTLIKDSSIRNVELASLGVPEQPALVVGRISNEDTLEGVRLERVALVPLDMHVGSAAKDS